MFEDIKTAMNQVFDMAASRPSLLVVLEEVFAEFIQLCTVAQAINDRIEIIEAEDKVLDKIIYRPKISLCSIDIVENSISVNVRSEYFDVSRTATILSRLITECEDLKKSIMDYHNRAEVSLHTDCHDCKSPGMVTIHNVGTADMYTVCAVCSETHCADDNDVRIDTVSALVVFEY